MSRIVILVGSIRKGGNTDLLAREINITPSYVNRLIRKGDNVVNKTFIRTMESLG